MKKQILILLYLTSMVFASNRADVTIIEARENIQYLSQKMATDYCLLYNKPTNLKLKKEFEKDIKLLEENILAIRNTTKNRKTVSILNFYDISLDSIKELLLLSPNQERIKLVLHASEIFLEGTASIDRQHLYKYNKEENMLVLTKKIQFLIERATKYYIAYQTNQYYDIQLKLSIKNVDKIFKKLEQYKYPKDLKDNFLKSKAIWQRDKVFFRDIKKSSFPNLLLISTSYIKDLLMSLEKHHKQNL